MGIIVYGMVSKSKSNSYYLIYTIWIIFDFDLIKIKKDVSEVN